MAGALPVLDPCHRRAGVRRPPDQPGIGGRESHSVGPGLVGVACWPRCDDRRRANAPELAGSAMHEDERFVRRLQSRAYGTRTASGLGPLVRLCPIRRHDPPWRHGHRHLVARRRRPSSAGAWHLRAMVATTCNTWCLAPSVAGWGNLASRLRSGLRVLRPSTHAACSSFWSAG